MEWIENRESRTGMEILDRNCQTRNMRTASEDAQRVMKGQAQDAAGEGRSIGDKPPQSLSAKTRCELLAGKVRQGKARQRRESMTSQMQRLQLERCARTSVYLVV
jgi:hypothetical protein